MRRQLLGAQQDRLRWEEQMEGRVNARTAQVHQLMGKIIFAQEEERKRIARELHDGAGQGIAAVMLQMAAVEESMPPDRDMERPRERGRETELQNLLTFESGDFHRLKYRDASFNVVWSQEAFLHGADKDKIISESKRVLMPGGTFIFTDLLVKSGTAHSDRERIYQRVRTPVMWDVGDYHRSLTSRGFEDIQTQDWSAHVARSYSWIRNEVEKNRDQLLTKMDSQTVDATLESLSFWVESANAGKIGWALFVAAKPVA